MINTELNEIYTLSKEQKRAIHEAREEIRLGESLTDAEADKEVEEWLKNKLPA